MPVTLETEVIVPESQHAQRAGETLLVEQRTQADLVACFRVELAGVDQWQVGDGAELVECGAWRPVRGDSSRAGGMRHSLWTYPIVEIVHIVGFAILVGSVVLFDLRLLGFSRTVSIRAQQR